MSHRASERYNPESADDKQLPNRSIIDSIATPAKINIDRIKLRMKIEIETISDRSMRSDLYPYSKILGSGDRSTTKNIRS
jgi:hypothetical protein